MAKKRITEGMPHSLEAEQSLLGCLLLDARIQVEVVAYLKEDDFYSESHRIIFETMLEIIKNNNPVDLVTLSDALERQGQLASVGGIEYLTQLANVMPSSANYQTYLDIVTRDSLLRKLIVGSADIIENCKNSNDRGASLSFAEKTIYDISTVSDSSEMVRIGKVIPDVLNTFDELTKDKSSLKGIKTGFTGLDNLTNGLHRSDLVIIAARPAVGKTSFAMNIVENVALQGYSCAVFSLEMGKEQITERIMCSVADVSMGHAKKGILNKSEWIRINRAKEQLADAKIFIDDSAVIRPRELMSKCRRIKSRFGLDLVMVDYIGLMTPDKVRNSDSRQNEIAEISRTLKILAKELDVPVLALSQLNRAVETRKGRPQLSDLRESGAIEQDADIVMFIHRPDKSATEKELQEGKVIPNVAEILVEKHRAGPTGLVKLYFKGECTKFVNLNEENNEPEGQNNEQSNNGYVPYEDLPMPTEEPVDFGNANIGVSSVDEEIF
ncbi:MAG: replicative DNA helicase [Clostridia bacterium]|nr:replicative DNA helicase [Clostridia bacterium]